MKIMVLLEIEASGEKIPRRFSRMVFSEAGASEKAYLIFDDVHEKIFLWLGKDLSRIHRRVAQRSSGFARGHGHEVEGYVVGRSFDVVEINEGDELPAELIDVFDRKLEIHDEYSVVVDAEEPVFGPVAPFQVTEEVKESFKGLITNIENEAAEQEVVEPVPPPTPTPTPAPKTTPTRVPEPELASKEEKDSTKNYVILPHLASLPKTQHRLIVEGLVQEALSKLEEGGMVSKGDQENSFIFISKHGDLLGTILLESGAQDELVYRASWTRPKDGEQFARLLTKLST